MMPKKMFMRWTVMLRQGNQLLLGPKRYTIPTMYQSWQFVYPCRVRVFFRVVSFSYVMSCFCVIQKLTHFSFNPYNFDIFVYPCRVMFFIVFQLFFRVMSNSHSCRIQHCQVYHVSNNSWLELGTDGYIQFSVIQKHTKQNKG